MSARAPRPDESQLALNNGGGDQGDDNSGSPDKPHAVRPEVLGMSLAPLDAAARHKFGLGEAVHGVVVEAVKEDSAAAQTGFHAGVVIARAGDRAAVTRRMWRRRWPKPRRPAARACSSSSPTRAAMRASP